MGVLPNIFKELLLLLLIILKTVSFKQMELDSRHLSTRVVHTRYGMLRGFISTLSNRQLQPVEVFLGVPYAGAPTGALRFMPPVTSPHWKGVRLADSFGSVCPQKFPDIKNETDALRKMPLGRLRYLQRLLPLLANQSEDCLYLNIYVPAVVGRQILQLPVMVYIHGESYEWNAGNPYDGRVLSSYGNVIVVTINYRLGILGFLPALDRSARGNYGLMDQVAALHWVQDNIAEFGGDPNNVTAFGQGHGAACINLLMLSPMAKGLFHRAILQSGSALCPWAIAKDAIAHTQRLAKYLLCPIHESMALIECLRKRSLEDIMSVMMPYPDHLSAFGPTIDGIVITRDPLYLMQSKPELFLSYDLIFGVTKVESYFTFSSSEELRGITFHRRDRILRTLVRNLYTYHLHQIFLTIINEYMDWSMPHHHGTDIFRSAVEALSDATVVSPIIKMGIFHSNPKSTASSSLYKTLFFLPKKTFFYVFAHQTEEGDYLSRLGCVTGEELAYIFGAPLVGSLAHFSTNFTAEEVSLAEMTIMRWTNFVKYGDPNFSSKIGDINIDMSRGRFERVIWPEFTSSHQKFLSISLRPKIKDHYNAHKLSYWLNLIPALDTPDTYTKDQHHMLHEHHNRSSYDGNVRDLYINIIQHSSMPTFDEKPIFNETAVDNNKTDQSYYPTMNSTDISVFGLDGGVYLSALGITIAVGCSLLVLNAVLFAGIYYQKYKIKMARKIQRAIQEEERRDSIEDRPFQKPYLLRESPTTLILHHVESLQSIKEQSMFDLVEITESKIQMSNTSETDLAKITKTAKIKTVTFVDPPTIFCDLPGQNKMSTISPE
ncbi:neuroligin-4, X-linked-like [Parasteatoda tepidariorum]|uniref:neuroligin-4, X-linked-like n=1 Tax=Parasteatoda tepidariorum TaxID=114398 RepID=UPI0039BCCE86